MSSPDTAASATRRRSGRVTRRPKFAPEPSPALSAKRKRRDEDGADLDRDSSSADEEESEDSQGEPDPEELKEQRRRKKQGRPAGKKPPQKKPKTNGEVNLAIRPAKPVKKAAKPQKATMRKSALVDEDVDGLYAEIFARGVRLEDVAAQWIGRFHEHEAKAVAELVNFVIRASGCRIRIDEDDIADPDNCPHRLRDIQDDYQHEEISEYPLVVKRGATAFRNALHGFFIALVQTIARSGLMFEDNQLMENIQVWVCTMSSATNRPFRHTSTVASMGITTGLAQVARDIAENAAKMLRQRETEAKKSRSNKSRLASIDKEVAELNERLEHIKSRISDWFDTVYVHRYRDVDHKVRGECCEALTEWIMTYPDMFFDGTHLRYLGWILSDTHESIRAEVLKQLTRLYRDKDKLPGLKTFTERFRPRIVEIATHDAYAHIRASAVDLLDVLRETGFLEPDDIDTVGKLIFDSEPRVRKAVVGFFAENVNAAYDLMIEDMGGQETLDEALALPDDDDAYDNPRLEWLKTKCLVQQLLSYDETDSLPSQMERITAYGSELGLVKAGVESRFALAAQALYDAVPEVRSWEVIAGYLLYDHSLTSANSAGEDAETMLTQNCKLEENEETALLDILNASVRTHLQRCAEAAKDKRRTKAQRDTQKAAQEETARRLTTLIPQLLKKFGALPEAAALCLRLERELNLDVFQELRRNSALTALLDDINKQFLTHHNERVVKEAIGSISHAQGNDELKEVVELKIQALWDDLSGTFDALRRGRDLSTRGNIDQNILSGVSNIVLKMSELAKLSEPKVLDVVAAAPKSKGRSQKHAALDTPPISSLLEILDRAVPGPVLDPEIDIAEDTLIRHTMSLMLFYFLWKSRHLSTNVAAGNRIPDSELELVAERRDACITALMRILETRKGADEVRVEAANLLLDVYNMFRVLKVIKAKAGKVLKRPNGRSDEDDNDDWEALCQDIDQPTVKLLLQILTALENNLAKRIRKRLEEPDVEDDPVDPDDEPESSDDEAEDDQLLTEKRLLAEGRLCFYGGRLVQSVLAGSVDSGESLVRTRLERNKTRLTADWKAVVAHLDANKNIKSKNNKRVVSAREVAKPARSTEVVIEDDSEDDDDDDEEEENEEEEEEEEDEDEDDEDVRGDPIEDEEMADAEERVNGEADGAGEDGAAEQSPEVESVLGD